MCWLLHGPRISSRGFTAIETILSVVLIGLVVTFLATVIPGAYAGMAHSEDRGNAAWIGWSVLDAARAADFDTLASARGTRTVTGTRDGLNHTREFSYDLQVETVRTGLKRLWVTVEWDGSSGRKSVVLETLVAEEG